MTHVQTLISYFFISLLLIKMIFFLIHLKEIKAVVQWTHVNRKKKPLQLNVEHLFIYLEFKSKKRLDSKALLGEKSGIFSTCSRTNDINNSLCYAWKQHFSWLAVV